MMTGGTNLSEGPRTFRHSTAGLPILLLHLSQPALCRAKVGKWLVKVVVEEVFTRRDLLNGPVDVVVQPREL